MFAGTQRELWLVFLKENAIKDVGQQNGFNKLKRSLS